MQEPETLEQFLKAVHDTLLGLTTRRDRADLPGELGTLKPGLFDGKRGN